MEDLTNLKVIACFYYPDKRRFETADGKKILNLYPLASPNMVFLFKHHKRTMTFVNYKYRVKVCLLYPVGEGSRKKQGL